jgi:ABC-type cobalamin/Fe3+-siderophores transport system ATPase subunit
VTGLIGHNGSGKSTLLKMLGRHQPPSEGDILLDGQPLESWNSKAFARKVAYLPQQLPPAEGMTVRELVAIGRYPWHGALGRFGVADREKVDEAIALVGLKPLAQRLVIASPVVSVSVRGLPCWWRRIAAVCCSMNRPRRWILPIRLMSWRWCIA